MLNDLQEDKLIMFISAKKKDKVSAKTPVVVEI
jgi:hypothetical protein